MGKNVAVFVDVANIFYAAKAAGVDIDYVTLLKAGSAGRDLVRAYAYTGLDPDNENQRNFHDFLRRSGYKVVSKDIRKYGDGKVKANLDIELVVDMMKTARNLDVAIVVSGDGDFAPAIRAVQEMGVRVEVVSFRGNTSSDLMDVADLFTDIIQIAKVEKGSSRSGRRVAADDDLSMTEVPDKMSEGTGDRSRGRGRTRRTWRPPLLPRRPGAWPLPRRSHPKLAKRRWSWPCQARSSRGLPPRWSVPRPADADVDDAAEDVEPGEPDMTAGADDMTEDGPRRRRRRGGRGRGRSRAREDGRSGMSDRIRGCAAHRWPLGRRRRSRRGRDAGARQAGGIGLRIRVGFPDRRSAGAANRSGDRRRGGLRRARGAGVPHHGAASARCRPRRRPGWRPRARRGLCRRPGPRAVRRRAREHEVGVPAAPAGQSRAQLQSQRARSSKRWSQRTAGVPAGPATGATILERRAVERGSAGARGDVASAGRFQTGSRATP